MAVTEITRLKLGPPVEAQPAPPTLTPDPDTMRVQIIAVMHGLAAILAARFVLLIACVGAIGLTYYSITVDRSVNAVVASALYDALVVIPIVGLAYRKG